MWKRNREQITLVSDEELKEWLKDKELVAFDIETTSLDYVVDGEIVSYAVGDMDTQFIFQDHNLLYELYDVTLVGANLMFDLSFIKAKIPQVSVLDFKVLDIYQIELRLTKGMNISRSYAAMVDRYIGVKISKDLQTSFVAGQPLTKEQITYQAVDVMYPIEILRQQTAIWEDEEMSEVLFYNQNKLIPVIADYTARGIRYDVEKHKENTERFKQACEQAKKKLHTYLKNKIDIVRHGEYSKSFRVEVRKDVENINFSSPQQLKVLFRLFDPSINNTSHGTLVKYVLSGSSMELREIITLLLEYRKYTKLVSTYGEKFLSYVHNGRIYTSIDTNTTTGRFASKDVSVSYINNKGKQSKRKLNRFVNFQNLPSNEIRDCFLPDEGYDFVTIDLDSCELRILAAQSGDPMLIAGVKGHLDLHSELATMSYRIIYDDPEFVVSKTKNAHLRKKHKPALFGMIYGAKPKRISEVLDIPMSKAKLVWTAIREVLHVAFEYLDRVVKQALIDGYIISNDVAKSRYILSEFNDHQRNGQYYERTHSLVRTLYNYRMQTTNADMIIDCLVNIGTYFQIVPANIRLSVYDEIGYQRLKGAEYIEDHVVKIIKTTCNKYLSNEVEMECSVNVANHWSK